MADRVIFVSSPPDEALRGPVVPEQMLADLTAITQISAESTTQAVAMLQRLPGFFSDQELAAEIAGVLQDKALGAAFYRTIQNIPAKQLDEVLRTLTQWRDADAENQSHWGGEVWQAVQDQLRTIVRDYPILLRKREATRLQELTTGRLRSCEAICDLRPVFSPDGKTVEGLIPQTALRISYVRANEDVVVEELSVRDEELQQLVETLQMALRNRQSLRASIPQWIDAGMAEE